MASPVASAQQYISPVEKLKQTADACGDALSRLSKGDSFSSVAKDFVSRVESIHGLNQSPNTFHTMGKAGNALSSGQIAALGLYAKVFTAGLDIAFGAEPSHALHKTFHKELHSACGPQSLSGASFGGGFRPF